MTDPSDCTHDPAACIAPDDCCQEHGVSHPENLVLSEVLRRFETEATRAVCETSRYRCPYYSWGKGPALVIVPGISDSSLSFVMVAARLSNRFRCIAYDLPTGQADGASIRRYTHSDLVGDLQALLDHLGIQQSYLLGCSFGSTIALESLRLFPERFPRAVLQGGFARRPLAPAEIGVAWMARFWPGTMRWLPLRRVALTRSHYEPFIGVEPDRWEYFLTRWGSTPITTVARRVALVRRLDLRPKLAEIQQPIMLVCGDRDPVVNTKCEEELVQGLPKIIRVEIPGCGHNPQFSHPEVYSELIARFLTPAACALHQSSAAECAPAAERNS